MRKVIGVTGGISSGKSNVISIIKRQGFKVIDCDLINHNLQKINMPIYNAIKEAFGSSYFLDNKELDRKKLGELIFHNENEKLKLNSISHPIIKEEVLKEINQADGIVFVDVPLLYESKFDSLCDKVICVYLNKETQIKRLMERDHIDYSYAKAKIASQMDLDKKRDLADYVIDSKGSFQETYRQVLKILEMIKGE
ncbi:MAG: dephospho-CoA kinase [Anaeroplasma sp.]|uniref:dephospho-CoA kinase n=1 Tax=Anaeroplasma sp. TaxID=1872523 RepID=UPI002A91FBDD|nr:dephospho-CoA kinase [Anaeroplasma sp.]MDY5982937.1 dephospho-CoA kinase [Anaeroplasma sp.]